MVVESAANPDAGSAGDPIPIDPLFGGFSLSDSGRAGFSEDESDTGRGLMDGEI